MEEEEDVNNNALTINELDKIIDDVGVDGKQKNEQLNNSLSESDREEIGETNIPRDLEDSGYVESGVIIGRVDQGATNTHQLQDQSQTRDLYTVSGCEKSEDNDEITTTLFEEYVNIADGSERYDEINNSPKKKNETLP